MRSGEGAPQLPVESEPEAINETENLGIRAKVVLDKSRVGEGVPEGVIDEIRPGFAFYEIGEDGKLSDEPFTVDMTNKPELVVVTDEDFENLRNKKIIAKPVNFIRSDKETWRLEF
jgi:hypothetical protein